MSTSRRPRRNTLEKRTESYEALRSLLIGEEREQLRQIEIRLQELEFETHDRLVLFQKIAPLFDRLLEKKLREKDTRTFKLLTQYMTRAIEESSQGERPELEAALRQAMTPMLARTFRDNQEKMIDALYPIMGGMVSKYVAQSFRELAERINHRIEEGVSLRRLRRKLKAGASGVSEAELLMREGTLSRILALMVIHKESGLLIAEASTSEQGFDDPHLVASMASAVKDFINDWYQSHNESETSGVEILSYGDATLYIESAGSVYIVAFLDAEPDAKLRKGIQELFADLVQKYRDFFQAFDGDDSDEEIAWIRHKLERFLSENNPSVSGTSAAARPWLRYILWIVVPLLLAWYGTYLYRGPWQAWQMERRIRQETHQPIEVSYRDGAFYLLGDVASFAQHRRIRALVDGSVSRPIVDRLHLSLKEMDRYAHTIHAALQHSVHETNRTFDSAARRYVDRALKPIDQRIATLTQQLRALRERNSSDPQMTKSLRALSADVAALRDQMRRWHTRTQPPPKPSQPTTAQLRRSAVKKLANAFAGTPGFDPETGALDCIQKPLFARGGVAVLPRARSYLDGELRRYITTLLDDPAIRAHLRAIVIEGHTDRTGDAKINRQISWQRASAVVQHLLELDWGAAYGLEHYLRPQAAHRYEPVIIEGAEKTDASRRIRIRFELDAEPPAQLPRKELP